MRRSRKKKLNSKMLTYMLFGIVAVFGLSIAYAVLTTSINIVGSGDVVGNNWYISMDIKNAKTSNNVWTERVPEVDGHRIRNIFAEMNVPGDYASFEVWMHNQGDIIAEIQDVIIGTPVCTSDTGNKADEELVCNNIVVNVNYADGEMVEKGDILYHFLSQGDGYYSGFSAVCKKTDLNESMLLTTNKDRAIYVEIIYKKDIDKVPSSKVTVSDIDFEFVFSQTDNDCKYVRNGMFG